MYVYYEHHKDANGKIVLTDLRMSSTDNGELKINFWKNKDKAIFEACKNVLKWVPVAYRSYDEATYIWSYFGQYGVNSTYGEETISKLGAVIQLLGDKFRAIAVENLKEQAVNNYVELNPSKAQRMKPEEFFYNHGAPASQPQLTAAQIQEKLKSLIGSTIDKKSYRQAALKYHPDRNNGDGSKMSELNMLWQLYNQQTV